MAEETDQTADRENLRNRSRVPDPQRFRVSKGTLRIDAFMTRFIFVGGLGVIVAIFGIFFFILAEIVPLFQGAKVSRIDTIETGVNQPLLIGTDEWTEYPFVIDQQGLIHFVDTVGERPEQIVQAPIPEGISITGLKYLQESQTILLGLSNGTYLFADVSYAPEFASDGTRTITASVSWDEAQGFASTDDDVIAIDATISGQKKSIAGILEGASGRSIWVNTFVQKRSLFGASGFTLDSQTELSEGISAQPVDVLVGANAEMVVVRCSDQTLHVFKWEAGDWTHLQHFRPFEDASAQISSADFIKGEVSLSITNTDGEHVLFSLYRTAETGQRLFGHTKSFEAFPGGATIFAPSGRNKALLLGNDNTLSLRYATTGDTRWEATTDHVIQQLLISGKFDRILGLTAEGILEIYSLRDPHPEAGFAAFFSKIWYEGQDRPQYLWQSTGGSDDFEPKLSLIPLIIGSFKGTFYALLFAVPIAILAAIYTSQFLNPGLKKVIKPGIEIMASLPSVVLGFLAALWLAPILEDRIPSVLLVALAIPGSAVLIGYLWNLLPIRIRILIPKGWEFIIFVPLIVIVSWIAWQLGPILESIAFRVTDPATGEVVADFRLWWDASTGHVFQQRNSLVVGFMMGFAVIPIIYTIAEDSLSAVPPALTSASLALGASRWQTTARIVLPTASAGIFSACMIGLGRAVGETMIVVMATGNTPILDFDMFSGMRTLSANIAVELPEAPHGGTLYRTLFLGAFVLFVLTFIVNTAAEVMRHRLRNRFKVVN
ncbi:MAG: ABC transporter permease subunit [Puniceicoccaceae bacterium]